MSFRATIVLGVIAAGLGLYVYLVELQGERSRQQAETEAKRLLSFESEQITALEVPLEGGGSAKLVAAGEGDSRAWSLETPVVFPADARFVSNLLSTLTRLEAETVIEDAPEDLAPFGLGEGRRSVRVWTGEDEPTVLHLGGEAPVGQQLYLARAEESERIYTVMQGQAAALEPRLRDLRDKRLVRFDVDDVKSLQVREYGSLVATVERTEPQAEAEDGGWRVIEPSEDRGDAERIQRALQDLTLARATDFIDQPGALAEYGLDAPELELGIETASGTQQLQISRVQDKGFVRVDAGEVIYRTSDRVLMNVPRSLFAYRYKQVLKLDADSVRRIELDFPREQASYAFVRENESWVSEDAEAPVKSLSVEDVLYAIEDLTATGIEESAPDLAALGLDPPRVRVRALSASGTELGGLELGDPREEDLAARSSANDRLWRVSNNVGIDVPLSVEAFERNFLEQPAETAADPNAGTPPPVATP